MATLTAYSSFTSDDGEDLDPDSIVTYDEYYDYSSIELTLYAEDLDLYLTYALTGDFYYYAGGWYGTASKFDFYVNYSKYYSLVGQYELSGQGVLDVMSNPFVGDDIFVGSDENDYFVFDKKGTDKFFGNGGNDYIYTNPGKKGVANGGDGDDFIVANGKAETLTGGAGNDILRILTTGQKEVVTDFAIGADLLEVALSAKQADIADQLQASEGQAYLTLNADQLAVGTGYKTAKDADDLFAYDLKTGYLYFDKDGQGGAKAVQIANFKNKLQFTADELADSLMLAIVGHADYSGAADDYLSNNDYGTL
jgi:Ca2+-binding RTX toxin-like protein